MTYLKQENGIFITSKMSVLKWYFDLQSHNLNRFYPHIFLTSLCKLPEILNQFRSYLMQIPVTYLTSIQYKVTQYHYLFLSLLAQWKNFFPLWASICEVLLTVPFLPWDLAHHYSPPSQSIPLSQLYQTTVLSSLHFLEGIGLHVLSRFCHYIL